MRAMSLKKSILISLLILAGALGACDGNKAKDAVDAANPGRDVAPEDTGAQAKGANAASEENEDAPRPSATSPGAAKLSARALLQIDKLLGAGDFKSLTAARIASEELAGKPAAADYRARRFYPAGGNTYGVGLQVWKLEDAQAAQGLVAKLRPQYLGVDEAAAKPGDSAQGFRAARAGIQTQVFAPDKAPGYVAALSCDDTLCKNGWSDVGRLAQLVEQRLTGSSAPNVPTAQAPPAVEAEPAAEEEHAAGGEDTAANVPAVKNKRMLAPLNRPGITQELRRERLGISKRTDVSKVTRMTKSRGIDRAAMLPKEPRRGQ